MRTWVKSRRRKRQSKLIVIKLILLCIQLGNEKAKNISQAADEKVTKDFLLLVIFLQILNFFIPLNCCQDSLRNVLLHSPKINLKKNIYIFHVLRLPCLIPHENKSVAKRLAIAVGHYLNISVLIMRCIYKGVVNRKVVVNSSVADPGCLSRIRILILGSKRHRISDPQH
jgi:hypothetical protein